MGGEWFLLHWLNGEPEAISPRVIDLRKLGDNVMVNAVDFSMLTTESVSVEGMVQSE